MAGYYPQGLEVTRDPDTGFPLVRGSGITIAQVASASTSRTVPNATVAAVTETVTAVAPAGGTGATAGGYDTAGNRDTAIASINEVRALALEEKTALTALTADVLALKKVITSLVDALQAVGMAS